MVGHPLSMQTSASGSASADAVGGRWEARPFGDYLLLHAFARGGMGELYLAAQRDRPVRDGSCVLKKLRPELTRDGEYIRRFVDEARVVVQLHHPNICHVFDVGRVADEYYLAMEYVPGQDVRSLQDRGRHLGETLPAGLALYLVCEVLEALDYAHGRNHPLTGEPLRLIHRDVSPQNVLIRYDGAVKLIDFGLASSNLKLEQTQPNVVMGKMAYMAPEQARGEAIDASVDLFAAAVLAYELISGERYYEGMGAHQIWSVVGRGDFRPRRWDALPPALASILGRALHPTVRRRFSSARAFRKALLEYLDAHHPEAGRPALAERMGRLFAAERAEAERTLLDVEEAHAAAVPRNDEPSVSLRVRVAQSDRPARVGRPEGLAPRPHAFPAADLEATSLVSRAVPDPAAGPTARVQLVPAPSTDAAVGGRSRHGAAWAGAASVGAALGVAASFGVWLALWPHPAGEDAATGRRAPALATSPAVSPSAPPASPGLATALRSARDAGASPGPVVAPRALSSEGAAAGPGDTTAASPTAASPAADAEPQRRARSKRVRPPRRAAVSRALPARVPSSRAKPPRRRAARAGPARDGAAHRTVAVSRGQPEPAADSPTWQSVSRSERVGWLRACPHPCRQAVSDAFVRLKIQERSQDEDARTAAAEGFDRLWLRCHRRCR